MTGEKRNGRDQSDDTPQVHLRSAFHKSVDEGRERLERTWPDLLATGFIGGIDVCLGLVVLLVVEHRTGSHLLGALGFGIGFIALTLGRGELFTENFLVPVAAVVARSCRVSQLFRLWAVTLVMNLAGGWVLTWLVLAGLPHLSATAIEVASFYPSQGAWQAFALGLVGGAAITLMTWMERGARSETGKIVAVASIGFLLAAGPLNHVVILSLEMFAAFHAEAPFGWAAWARMAGLAGLANLVGGLVLVTVLRLVQVGGEEIKAERRRGDRG